MLKKYHCLTERIFAQCGVYFRFKMNKQAKDEIDKLVRKYEREKKRTKIPI